MTMQITNHPPSSSTGLTLYTQAFSTTALGAQLQPHDTFGKSVRVVIKKPVYQTQASQPSPLLQDPKFKLFATLLQTALIGEMAEEKQRLAKLLGLSPELPLKTIMDKAMACQSAKTPEIKARFAASMGMLSKNAPGTLADLDEINTASNNTLRDTLTKNTGLPKDASWDAIIDAYIHQRAKRLENPAEFFKKSVHYTALKIVFRSRMAVKKDLPANTPWATLNNTKQHPLSANARKSLGLPPDTPLETAFDHVMTLSFATPVFRLDQLFTLVDAHAKANPPQSQWRQIKFNKPKTLKFSELTHITPPKKQHLHPVKPKPQ